MYRHAVVVEPGSWYRTDTASGSSTPTSVLQPDGVTTVPNAYGLTGSTVRNGSPQGQAVFLSTAATLYLKRLTYQGALSGDTPVTSVGRDLTPVPPADPTSVFARLQGRPLLVLPSGDTTGVTDRTAIAAALTAGGLVELARGDFYTDQHLLIPNWGVLRGNGPATTTLRLAAGATVDAIVRQAAASGAGTQEFMAVERMTINAGSGTVTDSAVLFDTMYVNSYIRDCTISGSSKYGLHITTLGSLQAGPVLVDNVWVLSCADHNIQIDGGVVSSWLTNVTSEQQAAGKHAVNYDLNGFAAGSSMGHNITNLHLEFAGAGSYGVRYKQVRSAFAQNITYNSTPGAGAELVHIEGAGTQNIVLMGLDPATLATTVNDALNSVTLTGQVGVYATPGAVYGPISVQGVVGLKKNAGSEAALFADNNSPQGVQIMDSRTTTVARFVRAGGLAYLQFGETGDTAGVMSGKAGAALPIRFYSSVAPGNGGTYGPAHWGGTGAPGAIGVDGDFYFRSDGGAMTSIYQRRSGAWTGIV